MIQVQQHLCPANHPCPVVGMCPTGAIEQESFNSAPTVNQELCTECGICTMGCPAFREVGDAQAV